MFLPYLDHNTTRDIFVNGEKVRTWDAYKNNLPGMFASVTGTTRSNDIPMNYLSACGVQELAFEKVSYRKVVTPYSTMGTFLAD
jgi:hypothetical protein